MAERSKALVLGWHRPHYIWYLHFYFSQSTQGIHFASSFPLVKDILDEHEIVSFRVCCQKYSILFGNPLLLSIHVMLAFSIWTVFFCNMQSDRLLPSLTGFSQNLHHVATKIRIMLQRDKRSGWNADTFLENAIDEHSKDVVCKIHQQFNNIISSFS